VKPQFLIEFLIILESLGEAAVSYRVSYHFGELGERLGFLAGELPPSVA
jgi:hypothetical protein